MSVIHLLECQILKFVAGSPHFICKDRSKGHAILLYLRSTRPPYAYKRNPFFCVAGRLASRVPLLFWNTYRYALNNCPSFKATGALHEKGKAYVQKSHIFSKIFRLLQVFAQKDFFWESVRLFNREWRSVCNL